MSVGPYWWPDPSKPDGLPYIRRDGEVRAIMPYRSHTSTPPPLASSIGSPRRLNKPAYRRLADQVNDPLDLLLYPLPAER